MSEKLKPIIINDPETGTEYTLEYNRKTVVKLESAGFDSSEMEVSPMKMIPLLFWGAFLAHQPYIKKDETDKILFDGMGGLKREELEYLAKLYAEPFRTLIADDEESGENPRRVAVKF